MVTIIDVAKSANVSIATVSHVINKTRFVSKELVKKVEFAIEELNYTPNQLATGLRQKKTGTIGIVVSDISIAFYAEFVKAAEEIISPLNYNIIIGSSFYNEAKELKILESMRAKRVDGILIFPEITSATEINKIKKSGIPIISIERKISGADIDTVCVNNEKATYEATKYLIDLGHKVIGFIDRFVDKSHSIDRRNGFIQALKDYNINYKKNLIIRGGFTFEDGYRNAKTFIETLPKLTAILTFGDLSAVGAIKAISEQSLRIPEDISILGHVDMSICNYTSPKITSINYPVEKMARTAIEFLLDRLRNPDDLSPVREVVLPLKLVVRESTGNVNPDRL